MNTLLFVYKWVCPCGKETHFVQVGLTSDRQLVALWKCTKCHQDIIVRKNLEELFKEIPANELTDDDKQFLKDFHIQEGE